MSDQGGTSEAGWQPDPHGRHEYRYWDGQEWTDQVSDGGVVSTDPPGDVGEAPTDVTAPPSTTDTVAQPVAGPPTAGSPAGPPTAGAPVYTSPADEKPKRKLPIGILALVGLGVAAVVAALVIFLGGDDGGGTGEFSGTISDDEPFVVQTFDLEAGEAVRAIVEPSDDLDARLSLGVEPDVATSEVFAGTDDIDVDDLLSDYSFYYEDLFSGSVESDLSEDLSEGLSDDFSDFTELLDEDLPSLADAGVPFGTINENETEDPEGFVFLAPVDGEYSIIVSGSDSEGDFDGNIDTAGPSDDFEELDAEDFFDTPYFEALEPLRDDLCEEDFWGGDPEDVNTQVGELCDDDEFEDLLSGDTSDDFSEDFTNDFSDDFSSDFSDDFSDDFSSDFSDDFSSDFSDDFSSDFSDDFGSDNDQGSIFVGDSVDGFISSGSRDLYTIEGTGDRVRIDVFGSNDTGGLDPTVELLDSDGNRVDFNDDADPSNIGDSQLRVRLLVGETYTIAVAGFSTSSGDYTLTIS